MVKNLCLFLSAILLLALVLGGCSDETVVPANNTQNTVTTLVEGDIDPNGGDFEYIVDSAGEGTDQPGPFAITGSNVQYIDTLGVLSVDFSVDNRGTVTHNEPVTLTFVQLLPETVTVGNPDNDENGAGAMIEFEFDNDDGVWEPGETSLPRNVQFVVGEGVSIGFVARIDVGMDETGGSIGGIVWHDVDENGEFDEGEEGLGGVEIHLMQEGAPQSNAAAMSWQTYTAADGTYRFDGLEAGHYTVTKVPSDLFRPTTPTQIEVILVETGGEVGDFLLADFGCVPVMAPERIEVGDWVAVTGEFVADPDRILAWGIDVVHCDVTPPPPDTMISAAAAGGGDDDHEWDGCDRCEHWGCWGLKDELRGPVTDVDRDAHALEVMGTWVHFAMTSNDTVPDDTLAAASYGGDDGDDGDDDHDRPKWKWLHPDDVEVGDRVRVRVIRWHDDKLYGFFLKEWNGTPEKVFGRVEWVSAPSGPIEAIRVLGVQVMITARTEIHFKR